MSWANEPANAPTGAVEVFACGTHSECTGGDGRGQSSDAGEGGIGEAVVDLVGDDEDVVLDTDVADGLELRFGENFTDRVVALFRSVRLGRSGKRGEGGTVC